LRNQFKLLSQFKGRNQFKLLSQFKGASLSAMGLLNGHTAPTPKDLRELILLCNLTGPCSALQITLSTHRNVDWSAMGLCEYSMLRGLVIAGAALCVHSVKNTALPSNRGG